MSWVINIDFQDGGGQHDISSLVYIDTILRTRTLYNKTIQPTVDSLKFKMHRNTSYINSLLTNETDTLITVTKDGSDYFTGTVRPNFKLQVGEIVGQVQIECVGYAEKLKQKINSTFAYGSYKVSDATTKTASIIHQLLVLAGFDVDTDISIPTIDKTIDYFVNIGGKDSRTYWDVITKMLFEFGYVWYFDESGVFNIYDFLPADTTTSDAFDNTNMRGKLTIERRLENFKGVDVIWHPHVTEEDVVVFSDTTGGGDTKCSIELAADEYYPDGVDTANVYSEYKFDGHDVIIVNNATLDETVESGIDTSFTSYYRRALVSFHNSAATAKSITKFDITGDVVYKGDQQKTSCLLEAGSEDIKDITAEYLTSMADADKLAIGMARHYKYSDFIYTVYSETDYDLGDFVDVEDNMLGIDNRCVIVKIEDIEQTQGLKKYTLYGISDYSAETTTIEADKSGPPPAAPGTNVTEADIATRPTYTEVVDGFTDAVSGGTTTPTTPVISVCKGVFRGIVLAWDSQENLTNFSRYEVQVSGDDSTWYSLEFDGSDWKDSEGADTDWLSEFLVHSAIPLDVSGGTDNPSGVTLYYRVRRVTKTSVASSWSSSASATTGHLDTGDYGANSIQANSLNVSSLSAITANLGTVTAGTIQAGVSIEVGALPTLSDANLEAYWSFDDGVSGSADGATITDNSGNGNNATASGCTWVPGKSGHALYFDGVNDSIDITGISVQDDFALSFFASDIEDWSARVDLFSSDISPGNNGRVLLYTDAAGTLATFFWYVNGSGFTKTVSKSDLRGAEHIYVHFSDAANDGVIDVYLDGVQNGTPTSVTETQSGGIITGLTFGASNGPVNYAEYTIDELRLYSSKLRASEIKYLYLNPGGNSGRTVISGNQITTGTFTGVNINLNDVFQVDGTTGIITYNATEVELGSGADASGTHSVAIGLNSGGTGDGVVAVGDAALTRDASYSYDYAIAIGSSAKAQGEGAISIGYDADATDDHNIAIGYQADATGGVSIAIGGTADATGTGSIGIGEMAAATATKTVAIGYLADADSTAQFDLNTNNLNLTAFYFASGTTENVVYDTIIGKVGSIVKNIGIIGSYQHEILHIYINTTGGYIIFYNINNNTALAAENGSTTQLSYDLKFMLLY